MKQEELKLGCSCLGEWLAKIRRIGDGEIMDSRLKTAGHMAEDDDAQGGFLVPEQWADDILHVALEDAIVRPRATVFSNFKGDSLKARKVVDSNRATSIFGGVTFTWKEEAGDKTYALSKPAVGEIELNPHKLVGATWVSNELEDDYGNFGEFMKIAFGRALRFTEDDSFIWGTGVGMPQGIAPSGAMIVVTRTGALTLDWPDFGHLAERLLPDSWNRAVWLINPGAMGELFEATAAAANQATVWDAGNNTIFGRPVIVSEKCAPMGSRGDLILADFQHYVIADREMYIAGSRHVSYGGGHYGFPTDETFWKIVLRVDGQPLMAAPIAPLRGANTLSAFVMLDDTS